MSTQAKLADALLRAKGYDGLWSWAMDQRRSVRPLPWDDVATRLSEETDGEVSVGGVHLRRWVRAAEDELQKAGAHDD